MELVAWLLGSGIELIGDIWNWSIAHWEIFVMALLFSGLGKAEANIRTLQRQVWNLEQDLKEAKSGLRNTEYAVDNLSDRFDRRDY